ncbi:CDP-alcohol phosphatidyltransferase family protein [Jannaschia rubra]|uniref:Inner membrane protein YnjF n=1 Tax=Jannaschia rubra TaxID=282197 RepID=A0A0M6XTH1_9RHOB|nr:CDP-alcohol phosphatidyltransferase family protein [Jannaschia rubra]CTQ34012.1 Inner membrane protein YnjF [Jannaschia rubra]SFG25179.1 Phosphatidylglycerophosphate synthase [Jannaschia rubra]
MLDRHIRRLIDPTLDRAGRGLAAWGATADAVTLTGLGVGLVAAVLIVLGWPGWALLPLLLSRLFDGLDGAVARARGRTDFGGYLDIWCDFVFYGAIPFAFALADPANALPAAFLILSFYINGSSFLGLAVQAEKRGLSTEAQGRKSLYYSAGLLEGTETIAFFVVLCLLPAQFAPLAWAFGALCLLTAGARVAHARNLLA